MSIPISVLKDRLIVAALACATDDFIEDNGYPYEDDNRMAHDELLKCAAGNYIKAIVSDDEVTLKYLDALKKVENHDY